MKRTLLITILLICTALNLYPNNPGEENYNQAVEFLIQANYAEAIANFQKSIDEGYKDAYFSLANMYYYRLGVQKDSEKAFNLAKEGHDKGSIPSSFFYARLLTYNIGDRKPNKELANQIYKNHYLEWLKDHYETEKNPFYACSIALLYGGDYFEIEKNVENVKYWYQKAIDQNFALGYTGMAFLYGFSDDEETDKELAVKYYQKAADLELPLGNLNLAIMLRDGDGVEQDLQRAIILFKKAIKDGYNESYGDLATIYHWQLGKDVDWFKAAEYYKKAAEHDVTYAKRNLGEYYYFGIAGIEKDEAKAIQLFREAADEGDNPAKRYLKVISDMKNNKFHKLNESEHGNSLYISSTESVEQNNALPHIEEDQTFSWYTKIDYTLGEADFVQIWPTTKIEEITDENDNFWFQTYSGSKGYAEKRGSHEAGIGIADDINGYRNLGYIYMKGVFSKTVDGGNNHYTQETLYIKHPVAICVLPANYPGVQETIASKKVDLKKEIIGKWKMINSFLQCSDSSENLALDADECTSKTTYEFLEDGTVNVTLFNWQEADPFFGSEEKKCKNLVSANYDWKIENNVLIIMDKYDNSERFPRLQIKGNLLTLGAKSDECVSGGDMAMDFRKVTN